MFPKDRLSLYFTKVCRYLNKVPTRSAFDPMIPLIQSPMTTCSSMPS